MSRTLFNYIFKDLVRIFMMASGAMAGIMSFGGLLRPLTREGLDAGQVARMLTYFGPAMTTYSFPVAALFATAVVYGRLAADNELTAAKAGGVSLLSLTIAGPALVLGLLVAIASLLFLCFVVPSSTLKVEQVIYSNLAKMVESRIERTHQIDMQGSTIFAQEAHVIPSPPNSTQQQVELIGPEIISTIRDPIDRTLRVPREFYTATRAYVYIEPKAGTDEINVTIRLKGGFKFPRRFEGATEAGIAETSYGPILIPSPIKEDVKFMNVWKLKTLYADLMQSQKLKAVIAEFVKNGQRQAFSDEVIKDINGPKHACEFRFANGDLYTLGLDASQQLVVSGWAGEVFLPSLPSQPIPKGNNAGAAAQPVTRAVIFRAQRQGEGTLVVRAASATLHAHTNAETQTADVSIDLRDCLQSMESADGTSNKSDPRERFQQQFTVPLSESSRAIAGQSLAYYQSPACKSLGSQSFLEHERVTVINQIIAESNGRASFAISCLILVMAGSALGMMFRSGNFLTAFAVSFIPALLSITLIIAGQRTAGNVPGNYNGTNNTLSLGLVLIWAGNAVNLVLAIGLLWKLGRR